MLSTLHSPLFFSGKGDRSAVDEVPTQAPDIVVSLSDALDSDFTANLIDALRAARVNAYCPPEAAVRAFNLCGGASPSNPPHAATRSPASVPMAAIGFAPPALVNGSIRPRFCAATFRSPELESVAPDIASQAHMNRAIVLPLEGKGDRFAVDEVN